jgi:hypothetical protein
MSAKGKSIRCRRFAELLAVTLVAGGCSEPAAPVQTELGEPKPEPSTAVASLAAPSFSVESRYFKARLEQTLGGHSAATWAKYSYVLEAFDVDPVLAARSALELATRAAARRQWRIAFDLIARGAALGIRALDVTDRASRLRSEFVSRAADDIEVRGPPANARLTGVSSTAAARFAKAEGLLAIYLQRRPSARLEEVKSSVRAKRATLEAAERAYRQVIGLGEPTATAAAEFRIASMYYDLSLSLGYDLTREMLRDEARKFRASLRAMAIVDRRRARASYRRALEAATGANTREVGRWREAAVLGLTSVEDLLRGG